MRRKELSRLQMLGISEVCGIAGIFIHDPIAPAPPLGVIQDMGGSLHHRGPDDKGQFLSSGIGLAFRRLSIIDLTAGHQPMSNEDDSIWLVFNGEIYNYKALRSDLESRGHRFKTRADSEVILHLYEEHGEKCPEFLRGMFAFAIYDQRKHSLFLARDRLGIKPLYYRAEADRLLFGSEPRAILAAGGNENSVLEPEVLGLYFALLYVPEEACVYSGMKKLAPGHVLTASAGRVKIARYWEPDLAPFARIEERAAAQKVRTLLEESVAMRLMADVPLGAFLSGGLDSAATVGIMAKLSEMPVKTFTIGLRDSGQDESSAARVTARFHQTAHREIILEPDAVTLVHKLAEIFDEPFGDPSAIPTYLVSQLARESVKVVMTGDGGDELFAGYHRYRRLRQLEWLRSVPIRLRRSLASVLTGAKRAGRIRQLGSFLQRSLLPFPDSYYASESFLSIEMRRAIGPLLGEERSGASWDPAAELYRQHARGADPVSAAQVIDLEVYLPGDVLTKVDRASMACSLEARVPILDHKVVEFVLSLPTHLKFLGGKGKRILHRACADLYPPEIVNRRKSGFGIPIRDWFRGPLRPLLLDTLNSAACRERGLFEPGGLQQLVQEHLDGRRDRSLMLYGLLMFELWAERKKAPVGVRRAGAS